MRGRNFYGPFFLLAGLQFVAEGGNVDLEFLVGEGHRNLMGEIMGDAILDSQEGDVEATQHGTVDGEGDFFYGLASREPSGADFLATVTRDDAEDRHIFEAGAITEGYPTAHFRLLTIEVGPEKVDGLNPALGGACENDIAGVGKVVDACHHTIVAGSEFRQVNTLFNMLSVGMVRGVPTPIGSPIQGRDITFGIAILREFAFEFLARERHGNRVRFASHQGQ